MSARQHTAALLLLASLSGCVADNPDYVAGVTRADMAACQAGERRCRGAGEAWLSQGCQDGRWTDDRRCPTGSACQAGYCQPPTLQGMFEGRPCTRENECFFPLSSSEYSCQPFVVAEGASILVAGFCTAQVGQGLPGTSCQPPDGRGCRTGFCDETPRIIGGGSGSVCYRACAVSADCPTTARFVCSEARLTVEGVRYTGGRSCVPADG